MKLNVSFLFIIMFLTLCAEGIGAQEQNQEIIEEKERTVSPTVERIMRPYSWSDNMFWGIQIGGGYSMSEFVKELGILKSIRPHGSFHFGKYFNPLIGVRANVGYHWQQSSVDPAKIEKPDYNVHFGSAFLDGMLCVNRLVSPHYNPDERYQLVAIAGVGALYSFDFSKRVDDWQYVCPVSSDRKFSWALRAGGQIQIRLKESMNFNVQTLWYMADPQYNGMTTNTSPRHFFEFGIGLTTRLLNRYGSRRFDYCRGNEVYYFREFEDRLLAGHEKQLKKYRKGKAEEPTLAAEQDSVLIFPVGYPYLTKRQEQKLDKVISYLEANNYHKVTIDLYPIVLDDPKMTPVQSVDRVASVISRYVLKGHDAIQSYQLVFNRYPYKKTPFPSEGIWIHGAIIHLGGMN